MRVITAENYPVDNLKILWKKIFGDTDEYISLFFKRKFKPENTFIIDDNGLKSMAFAVDEKIGDYKCAYICGVATDESSRGMGCAGRIMEYIKSELEKRGYDFLFLIPASESLFSFYEKSGFETFSYLSHRSLSVMDKATDDDFTKEYNYEMMNRFYTQFFDAELVERDENAFKAIFDCYGNVRIYKSGYIIYYIENGVINIVEHTMSNVDSYAYALMKETGVSKAVVTEFNAEENKPFTMIYKFRPIKFRKPVYVNLMLN